MCTISASVHTEARAAWGVSKAVRLVAQQIVLSSCVPYPCLALQAPECLTAERQKQLRRACWTCGSYGEAPAPPTSCALLERTTTLVPPACRCGDSLSDSGLC
jgi:hypothetical protein